MASKLACIILFSSFLSVANSIRCYLCGSFFASCDESHPSFCEGAGCAKFQAELSGSKLVMKYCKSGLEGCSSTTVGALSGTLCQCNLNYCNHSSRNPRYFPAIYLAIIWFTFKLMI